MSRILVLFILCLGCKNTTLKQTILADTIKKLFLSEINDIERIDTLYVIVTPYSEQSVNVMQAAEYQYAAAMLKKQKSADTLYFQSTANSIMDRTDKLDDTKAIYYRLATTLTYFLKDKGLNVAEKWFFIDRENKIIDEYKIVTQVSAFDNNDKRIYPFSQLTEDDIQALKYSSAFLKF